MKPIPIAMVVALSFVPACGPEPEPSAAPVVGESADAPEGTRRNPFVGRGIVQAVEGESRRLVIQHGDIPGFMVAMTMAFPVAEEVSLETVQTSDDVRFEIEVLDGGGYQIFTVSKAGSAP